MLKDVIKEARLEKGFTQEQIAQKVKVAKQTYLKWENGDTEPKATQIKLLAENLGLTADEICKGKRNTRYNLEEFILKNALNQAPKEIKLLETWLKIPDHKEYFDDIEQHLITEETKWDAIGDVLSIEQQHKI